MQQLPNAFTDRMKTMLKDEYSAFLESYQNPRQYGLRVNTLKISPQEFLEISPFHLKPIPWIPNGYFYEEEDRPAKHPYYFAGLYYLQEPSAMTPASRLAITPGDRVLDLCAAPGGKATELGANLMGQGLLFANEISNSRAKALLRNIELFGISNSFVANESPKKLASNFPEYFNKILVDAPCSGEGMFRKNPAVAGTWDTQRPQYFSDLQKEIITCAVQMLMPGGLLLYSTCTFSPEENEGTISYLLENFSDMEIIEVNHYEGFDSANPLWGNKNPSLSKCVRIWPHRMEGEGHFIALLRKKGESHVSDIPVCTRLSKSDRELMETFFQDITPAPDWSRVEVRSQKAYYLPPLHTDFKGISFLRNGLYLGELKKNRFEPSQPLAMALKKGDFATSLNLSAQDERVKRYLKGETLSVSPDECVRNHGWQLVCVDGYPLGWGKLVNGVLKNKYAISWRMN